MRGRRSELWQGGLAGEVPEHYLAQVQHQMMVSGAAQAHLWIFDGTEGVLVTIERNDLIMARIRQSWDAFQDYVDEDRPPPLADDDTRVRDDDEWLGAARAYVDAKTGADRAGVLLDDAKKMLVSICTHQKECGAGVTVLRVKKAGSIDYKRVPQLADVDLEQYRGPQREEIHIKTAFRSVDL